MSVRDDVITNAEIDDDSELPPLQRQAIEWLMLLRTKTLSDTETRAFADWLSSDISHAEAFAKAEDLFGMMSQTVQMPKPAVKLEPVISPVPAFTLSKHPSRLGRHWFAVPLGLAVSGLLAVNLGLAEQGYWWDALTSDYHTATGEQRRITLADGSEVLLNTDSAVSVRYDQSIRRIVLHHGQARFMVVADAARPYQVEAGELAVRALGTVFDVYRQANDDIDVFVEEHAVAASLLSQEQKTGNNLSATKIKQGEQLRYGHDSRKLDVAKPADSELSNAWTQHQVIVDDRPLAELIAEIERYRPGRVFLRDNDLKNLRVSGLFSMADPDVALDKVANILKLRQTRIAGRWVILHR